MEEPDRTPKILLVDDDPSVRRLLKRWMVQQLEAEVIEAVDGLEVLVALRDHDYIDLVITDLTMPTMDGFDLIQVIRADPLLTHSEVVIVSSICVESRVRKALSLKVSDFILKPLQHETVIPRIELCLKRSIENAAKRGSGNAPGFARILIADSNSKFRETGAIALAGRYTVETARSATDFLIKIQDWDPSLVLLAPTLDGLDASFLAEKASLIAHANGRECTIYTLAETLEYERAKGTHGVIPTGPSIDDFTDAVAAAIGGATGLRPEAIRNWIHELAPELPAGVDATFKTLVGSAPNLVENFEGDPSFDYFASLTIDDANIAFSLHVQFQCEKSTAKRLVAGMTNADDAVQISDEDIESGIGEMISIIGGGLVTWCTDHGLEVKSSLPRITECAESVEGGVHYCDQHFEWEGLPIELSFSASEGAGRIAEVTEPPPQTAPAVENSFETTSII